MQTEIIEIRDEEELKRAGAILKSGGLVAFPTETVYGLGGDALNPQSSRKIYAAKGRPSDNPLIVHICKWEDLYPIVSEAPEAAAQLAAAERIAKAFWPGPLTMILPKSGKVPYETTGGLDTVAIRMPSHPIARKLIEYAGGYVAAPSANTSGKPSPTKARHVAEDLAGRIEMIIDGGQVGIGVESTIIDLTVSPPQLLRPGYITEQMLAEVLGPIAAATPADEGSGKGPKAPGMKYRHYAPKGELTVIEGATSRVAAFIREQIRKDQAAGEKTGILCAEESLAAYAASEVGAGDEAEAADDAEAAAVSSVCRADVIKCLGSRQDEEAIARHLYAALREFDEEKVTKIYSESFSSEGFGQAIMNRLLKAAGHRVIDLDAVGMPTDEVS